MSHISWRGVVGVVMPAYRTGIMEELMRLIPEGVGIIPVYLDDGIKEGTKKELVDSMAPIKEKVAKLASLKVDLIHPAGVPPFVMVGYKGEAKIVSDLEQKHGIPVFTSGISQVKALKAFGVKRLLGVTYFGKVTNQKCNAYLTDAGFEVLGVEEIVTWAGAGLLSWQDIYGLTKAQFLKKKNVQGLWIPGGWGGVPALKAAHMLEQDLQVPVVADTNAKIWTIQKQLHIRQPLMGHSRLLAELP